MPTSLSQLCMSVLVGSPLTQVLVSSQGTPRGVSWDQRLSELPADARASQSIALPGRGGHRAREDACIAQGHQVQQGTAGSRIQVFFPRPAPSVLYHTTSVFPSLSSIFSLCKMVFSVGADRKQRAFVCFLYSSGSWEVQGQHGQIWCLVRAQLPGCR